MKYLWILLFFNFLSVNAATEYLKFKVERNSKGESPVIFYFSEPKTKKYPILVLCGGSSNIQKIESIISFHKYFLADLKQLNVGVLSIENFGVDEDNINTQDFINNYTRSQRLLDHKRVIDYLIINPPIGWNGKLIFLGVSEGGPIVTKLTEIYSDTTLATINWSGASEYSWQKQLWIDIQQLVQNNPKCPHDCKLNECKQCLKILKSKYMHNKKIKSILQNPTVEKFFLGMTYKYHSDALLFPKNNYLKLNKPFLVVTGVKDSIIESSDAFVKKAKYFGVNITYFRISDMDHYIRLRPDVIKKSFEWLNQVLD